MKSVRPSDNIKKLARRVMDKLEISYNATTIRHLFPAIHYQGNDEVVAITHAVDTYGLSIVELKLKEDSESRKATSDSFDAWEVIY